MELGNQVEALMEQAVAEPVEQTRGQERQKAPREVQSHAVVRWARTVGMGGAAVSGGVAV